MQLKLRDQQLKTILYIYVQTAISKPHGNRKPKIYNRYTKKEKQSKHNTKDAYQIIGEKNKTGREEKRTTKTNPKQLRKW